MKKIIAPALRLAALLTITSDWLYSFSHTPKKRYPFGVSISGGGKSSLINPSLATAAIFTDP